MTTTRHCTAEDLDEVGTFSPAEDYAARVAAAREAHNEQDRLIYGICYDDLKAAALADPDYDPWEL